MKIYNYEGKANVIGPRVRKIRKQLKLSQDELAAKMQVKNIDVTQRVISRIETQERFVADFELRAGGNSGCGYLLAARYRPGADNVSTKLN